MSEARTPRGERIERTQYGECQHEAASTDESERYGDPQHDVDRLQPGRIERLRYEDRHWGDGRCWNDDGLGDDELGEDDAQEASDGRNADGERDEDDGGRDEERPAAEATSGALVLFEESSRTGAGVSEDSKPTTIT